LVLSNQPISNHIKSGSTGLVEWGCDRN